MSVLATAGILFFGAGSQPTPPTPPAASALPAASGARVVTVHVAGAVARPGLVGIAEGSRIADAIAAAGGINRDADLTAVNLAASVRDGDQIVVPSRRRGSAVDGAVAPSDGRVRINLADAAELEELPGIGPVLAVQIVEYRNTHGPFAEVEDLLDVPGIGEAKLATLRDSVAVP